MALSAEYYMMRKEAVRELMETRQKQVDQITNYMCVGCGRGGRGRMETPLALFPVLGAPLRPLCSP